MLRQPLKIVSLILYYVLSLILSSISTLSF
ncbi:hypothetical protein OIU79_009335 [Salix purpurea]|uniref:Uncharacterized protein n=1 Tax=Salix purpurea TaxID=77065 RepID=A0A9Q0TKL6_SALPP|nr:hypothetical protein OIU79_009335 [Salix purpurea]